jgi:hypothetical protein
VELVFFQSDANSKLGKHFDGEDRLCCWNDQAQAEGCTLGMEHTPHYWLFDMSKGRMIIDPVLFDNTTFANKFYYWSIFDPANNGSITNKTVSSKIIIHNEGIWYQWIVYCAHNETVKLPDISWSGASTWMNPYGQIPADIFAFLPLYMCVKIDYNL